MKILLDTHIVLWWFEESKRLSYETQKLIAQHDIFVSSITAFEIGIKSSIGKLEAPDNFLEMLEKHSFIELPVSARHGLAVANLPRIHGDPFDRLLVVQAMLEGMTLLTHDERLKVYGPCVKVV